MTVVIAGIFAALVDPKLNAGDSNFGCEKTCIVACESIAGSEKIGDGDHFFPSIVFNACALGSLLAFNHGLFLVRLEVFDPIESTSRIVDSVEWLKERGRCLVKLNNMIADKVRVAKAWFGPRGRLLWVKLILMELLEVIAQLSSASDAGAAHGKALVSFYFSTVCMNLMVAPVALFFLLDAIGVSRGETFWFDPKDQRTASIADVIMCIDVCFDSLYIVSNIAVLLYIDVADWKDGESFLRSFAISSVFALMTLDDLFNLQIRKVGFEPASASAETVREARAQVVQGRAKTWPLLRLVFAAIAACISLCGLILLVVFHASLQEREAACVGRAGPIIWKSMRGNEKVLFGADLHEAVEAKDTAGVLGSHYGIFAQKGFSCGFDRVQDLSIGEDHWPTMRELVPLGTENFTSLKNLTVHSLQGDESTVILPELLHIFSRLDNLRLPSTLDTFECKKCGLDGLPKEVVELQRKGMVRLRLLDLSGNELRTMDSILPVVSVLEHIDISGNRIVYTSGMFQRLMDEDNSRYLSTLNISFNNIDYIDEDLLQFAIAREENARIFIQGNNVKIVNLTMNTVAGNLPGQLWSQIQDLSLEIFICRYCLMRNIPLPTSVKHVELDVGWVDVNYLLQNNTLRNLSFLKIVYPAYHNYVIVDGLLNSSSEGDDMFSEEEEDRLEDSLRENEEIRSSDEFWRRHAELGEASAEARAGTGSLIERIEAMMSFLGHSSDGYKEEFQSVVNSSRNPKACFTELSMDMKKRNRYANVIPLDASRVRVSNDEYINANFVDGKVQGHERRYIAAQAPKVAHMKHWWQMIWEHGVEAILMLTKCKEGTKIKASPYWSTDQTNENEGIKDEAKAAAFGPFLVETEFEGRPGHDDLGLIERRFRVTYEGEVRIVTQYQYTGWPDFAVPTDFNGIDFLLDRMDEHCGSAQRPVIVHCSAGIGRTGTVIALHIALQKLRAGLDPLEISETVGEIRRQRDGSVVNVEQYKFIYEYLRHYLKVRC
eukprot:g1904.t1